METVFDEIQSSLGEVSREKVKDDLRVLIRDAEALLKATSGDLNDQTKEARSRLAATLEKAKATCQRFQERTVAAAKATDQVIRNHPYESMGVAFGVGLLIGVLAMRR